MFNPPGASIIWDNEVNIIAADALTPSPGWVSASITLIMHKCVLVFIETGLQMLVAPQSQEMI